MGCGSFVAIVPAKSLERSPTGMIRATHAVELQACFSRVDWVGREVDLHFLPGGGLAVDVNGSADGSAGRGASVAIRKDCMAAFNGKLTNYSYLVRKYCLANEISGETGKGSEEAILSTTPPALRALKQHATLDQLAQTHPLSDAEVLLILYERLGTTLLPKLRGEFAFCVFDSKSVRVLAARDPHGAIELAQAKAPDGSLVIASGQFLPEGCTNLQEVLPGYFKYGWSAPIQRYAHSEQETRQVAETAAAAAARALEASPMVLRRSMLTSHVATPADSESGSESGSAKLRTRRGKRAGRHQQQRASLEVQRRSMDGTAPPVTPDPPQRPSRLSLDSQSPGSRVAADRATWWRPAASPAGPSRVSPQGRRQSVDCGAVSRRAWAPLSALAPIFEPPGSAASGASTPAAIASLAASAALAESAASPPAARPATSADTAGSTQTQMTMPVVSAKEAAAAFQLAPPVMSPTRAGGAPLGAKPIAIKGSAIRTSATAPAARSVEFAVEEHDSRSDTDSFDSVAPRTKVTKADSSEPADHLRALDELPQGLVDTLAGPYREDVASMHMLANLLHHSPCALCITDAQQPDMPIVHVNRTFEEATGYSAAEVLGRNCRFLQAPPGKQRVPTAAMAAIRSALQGGRAKGVRLLNYHKDGTAMYNDLSIVPLRGAGGVVTHFVGMQTFSPAAEEAHPDDICGSSPRAVQRQGGLTGLLAKSRSCVELRDVAVMGRSLEEGSPLQDMQS